MKKRLSKRKRWWRRLLVFFVLMTLLAGSLVVLVTPWGLRQLTPILETRLSGMLSLEVTIEDPVLKWPLALKVKSISATDPEGRVRFSIQEANVRVSLRQLLQKRVWVNRFTVETLRFSGLPAAADEEESGERKRPLRLPDLDALLENVRVKDLHVKTFRLEPPFVAEPVEGSIQGSYEDRVLLSELELRSVAGRIHSPAPRFSFSLEVSPYNRFHNRDLVLSLRAEEFAELIQDWPEGLEDDAELYVDLRETRETTLRVSKGYLRHAAGELILAGELDLAAARLSSTLDLSIPDLSRFQDRVPVELSGAVRLKAEVAGPLDALALELELDQMELQVAGITLASGNQLRLSYVDSILRMEPWELRIGKGRFRITGGMKNGRPDFSADILEFPLSEFGFASGLDPNADLDGEIHLGGTLAGPEARLTLDFRGLRPENPDAWDGPPARFRGEVLLADQKVTAQFRLEDLPGDPVTLDVEMPLDLSLAPFHLTWPPEGKVNAHLLANTDLAGLSRLFVLDVYHNVAGMLQLDVQVTGTLKHPQVHGVMKVESGRYEHELTGTLLREISLEVTAEPEHLTLSRFEAKDGSGGTVTAEGRVQLNPAERFPFEGAVDVKDFRLMQNDQVEAGGNGRLELRGNLDESHLTGRMTLAPLNVNLPEHLPPRLYELEVVDVYGENDPRGIAGGEPVEGPSVRRHRLRYDLTMDAPGRVFVRGRGLDSEWSGRISVKGERTEPRVTGSLSLVRGRFVFFGKRLQLTRGDVTFDGASPPSPRLDAEAQVRSGGILGTLRISGMLNDPQVELSSSPPLPEDEILARMLFGRESARISPWQALTLAQAVRKLRGGGSAFDFMGETRRVLRVDQIDIRSPEEEEEGTKVTVGKYLSDRVYVEYEQSVGEQTGRASVEVDLTPSIRLESTSGGDSDTGIGIRWIRDY